MLTVVFGAVILLVVFAGYERYKWQKVQQNGILCEFTTDTGQVLRKVGTLGPKTKGGTLVIIKDRAGMVVYTKDGTQQKDETIYVINTDSTYHAQVPESSLFKALVQVTVPKAYYKMGDPKPQKSKSSQGVDTARIISDLWNEKCSAIVAAESMKNNERDKMLKKVINPMVVYVGIGIIGLICVISMYFAYKTSSDMSNIKDDLEIIKRLTGG
jgi:hypothetical protein